MNKRKLASALLAGALLFISTLPASAADVADVPTPEQVFYREEPGQTFAGQTDMEEKEATKVEAGHPAFSLSVYDTLDVSPATGSAVLTVKDARTLKPVSGAKYAVYCDGHIVKSNVESNELSDPLSLSILHCPSALYIVAFCGFNYLLPP